MCLPDSKGRTKGRRPSTKKFSIPPDLVKIGQKFYKDHMMRLFEIIYPERSKVGFKFILLVIFYKIIL